MTLLTIEGTPSRRATCRDQISPPACFTVDLFPLFTTGFNHFQLHSSVEVQSGFLAGCIANFSMHGS